MDRLKICSSDKKEELNMARRNEIMVKNRKTNHLSSSAEFLKCVVVHKLVVTSNTNVSDLIHCILSYF